MRFAHVDRLPVNRARSFIFSTAPAPAVAAEAAAAVEVVQSCEGEARRGQLWQRVTQFTGGKMPPSTAARVAAATNQGFNARSGRTGIGALSAIIPFHVGEESKAVEIAGAFLAAGIYLPAIRYPTVKRGQARLRIAVTASHTAEDVSVAGRPIRSQISNLKAQILMHQLARLDHHYVWHPFTQMRDWLKREPVVIVSGKGAVLRDAHGRYLMPMRRSGRISTDIFIRSSMPPSKNSFGKSPTVRRSVWPTNRRRCSRRNW